MGGLLNAVLDQLSQLGIVEPPIRAPLHSISFPVLCRRLFELVCHAPDEVSELLRCDLLFRLEVWHLRPKHFVQPLRVRIAQGGVPVIEDGKLDRYDVSRTTIDPVIAIFNLST